MPERDLALHGRFVCHSFSPEVPTKTYGPATSLSPPLPPGPCPMTVRGPRGKVGVGDHHEQEKKNCDGWPTRTAVMAGPMQPPRGGYITAGSAVEHPDETVGMVLVDTAAPFENPPVVKAAR